MNLIRDPNPWSTALTPWTQSTITEHDREARQDEDESQVEIDREETGEYPEENE